MTKPLKRPDLRDYFRSRIDYHTNGMLAGRGVHWSDNRDIKNIDGDVTSRVITVTMVDGTIYKWSGGQYSQRKINLCYPPLMPKPIK